MSRLSWSSGKEGRIQLGDRQPSDVDAPKRNIPVPKGALEDGILHLLATAAEMQQRQDLESANQLYEAAISKMRAHKLDRKKFLTGTSKKPAPLNSRTAIEWSLHVGDVKSAITLLGDPNTAFTQLVSTLKTEQIESILDAGANIEHRIGPFGRTLLLREAAEGRPNGVELALKHGASLSCMDDNGDSVLPLALRRANSDASRIVELLLEAGADANLRDGQGQPMLKLAATHSSPEAVKQVIDTISPITAEHQQQMQDYVSNLPLDGKRLSVRTSGVIRLLLEHGLDPNTRIRSRSSVNLLDLILRQGAEDNDELVSEMLERGSDINLDLALQYAQPQSLELVLSKLTPLSEGNRGLMTAWTQSIISSSRKWSQRDGTVLSLLLEFGLDPNIRGEKPPHSPLIICATKFGDAAVVEKLIACKANLSASNDSSDTAIVLAAKSKNRPIYDALKAGGINDKYFFGWTVWSSYANG